MKPEPQPPTPPASPQPPLPPLSPARDVAPVPTAASNDVVDANSLTPEEQMARFEQELKETDWGHQPC